MTHPVRLWFLDTDVTILVSEREESHHLSVMEHHARLGDSPPLHRHLDEDETFHVIAGRLRVRLGDATLNAGPGETLRVPMGVPHTYRVDSADGARFLTITGGRRFEGMVRALGRAPTAPGLPPPSAPPGPAEVQALAEVALHYGVELLGPPLGEAG